MKTVVMKFGGSSLATVDKINHVAQRVLERRQDGSSVVVVVSAMGDTTEQYLKLAREISPCPNSRELDVLLTAGEQISISLLSMAIQQLGGQAISLTGRQAGFETDGRHSNATIVGVECARVKEELTHDRIAVVAGFQGLSPNGEITTLGRGGSDTSAVALAASLQADCCEIYSDVDGVYSADPRTVPGASLLEEIDYDEMLEFARHGARVLKSEAVKMARHHQVALSARSTFKNGPGTYVRRRRQPGIPGSVLGITGRRDLLRLQFDDRPTPRGLVEDLAECELLYPDPTIPGGLGYVFTSENVGNVEGFIDGLSRRYASHLKIATGLGAVSAVGEDIGTNPSIGLELSRALREKSFAVGGSSFSQHSVTCLLPEEVLDEAVAILHASFVEAKNR